MCCDVLFFLNIYCKYKDDGDGGVREKDGVTILAFPLGLHCTRVAKDQAQQREGELEKACAKRHAELRDILYGTKFMTSKLLNCMYFGIKELYY